MTTPRRGIARAATAVLAVVALCAAAWQSAGAQQATDSRLRAAFLFNFGQYVEWPQGAGAAGGAPLVIGVYDDTELEEDLRSMVEGRQIGGNPVQVRHLDRPDELDGLAIVYIGTEDPLEIGRALRAASGLALLTVGFTDGFAERGGMINFVRDDRRMGFEVNRAVAERSGLSLSSQLLRLARIVGTEDGRSP